MKNIKSAIENCAHATLTGTIKISNVCSRRGGRVNVYHCSYYNVETTRELYKPYQREMYCMRCLLIREQLDESST